MPNFKLSPAIEDKYRLDKSQTSPTMTIEGFGDIDLRSINHHDLHRLQELGIKMPFLIQKTKPKKSSILK